jgi:hypothetical protein
MLFGQNFSQFVDHGSMACEELYEENGAIIANVKGRGTVLIHNAGIGELRGEKPQPEESKSKTKKATTNRGKAT